MNEQTKATTILRKCCHITRKIGIYSTQRSRRKKKSKHFSQNQSVIAQECNVNGSEISIK